MRDTFHQTPITHEDIGVMIHNVQTRPVEFSSEQVLCQRHANCIRDALTERACRGFHARRDVDFRMARGERMQLPEMTDLVH